MCSSFLENFEYFSGVYLTRSYKMFNLKDILKSTRTVSLSREMYEYFTLYLKNG